MFNQDFVPWCLCGIRIIRDRDVLLEIVETVFEVYNELGPGYSEGIYEFAKICDIRPLV